MKRILLSGAAILWTGFALAQSLTNSYSFPLNQAIPAGTGGYATTENLTGITGPLVDLSVTLDITGGFNGDLYAYLVGPAGNFAVLLNRAGVTTGNSFGYGDGGFQITLNDNAAYNNIHFYQTYVGSGPVTGTWASDGENVNPQSSLVGTVPATATLSSFNGTNPNGLWTLFIADLSSGAPSTLTSWGLVMTVPEPSTWAFGATGLVVLMILHRLRKTRSAGR